MPSLRAERFTSRLSLHWQHVLVFEKRASPRTWPLLESQSFPPKKAVQDVPINAACKFIKESACPLIDPNNKVASCHPVGLPLAECRLLSSLRSVSGGSWRYRSSLRCSFISQQLLPNIMVPYQVYLTQPLREKNAQQSTCYSASP